VARAFRRRASCSECSTLYSSCVTEPEASRRRGLRQLLEDDLRLLAAAGVLHADGERELRIRLDTYGNIRWVEATRIRVPASELESR
jgi:hypothetical protein